MPPNAADRRATARQLGVVPGELPAGPLNSITDVPGVAVGQVTIDSGSAVRTGVTAVRPHPGNVFLERVPAAIHVGNGFGKLIGSTQLAELGELETPILLTCTLGVWKAADALAEWMLGQPGMEQVRSINPVVAETNDGVLNDIRSRPVSAEHVRLALESARAAKAVEQGSVGAGRGTVAFGWKGGIGSASRRIASGSSQWSIGVLVQSNFGGILQVLGAPVGKALGRKSGSDAGSIVIVVATDAPLSERNLGRLAARAMIGLGRTGSSLANGSGDYAIAFSTAPEVRRPWRASMPTFSEVSNDRMNPLFQAVVEATEEAIYNSIFAATTVSGNGATVEAIPLDAVAQVLERHGIGAPAPEDTDSTSPPQEDS